MIGCDKSFTWHGRSTLGRTRRGTAASVPNGDFRRRQTSIADSLSSCSAFTRCVEVDEWGALRGVTAAEEQPAFAAVVSTGSERKVAIRVDGTKVGGAKRIRAERGRAIRLPLLLGHGVAKNAILQVKQVLSGVGVRCNVCHGTVGGAVCGGDVKVGFALGRAGYRVDFGALVIRA